MTVIKMANKKVAKKKAKKAVSKDGSIKPVDVIAAEEAALVAQAEADAKADMQDEFYEEVDVEVGAEVFEFKNVTKYNVFTTAGRVHSGDCIFVPKDEGHATPGLELV